jgi:hypothetical protein
MAAPSVKVRAEGGRHALYQPRHPTLSRGHHVRVRRVGAFRAAWGAMGELSYGAVPRTPSGQPTLDASRSPSPRTAAVLPKNSADAATERSGAPMTSPLIGMAAMPSLSHVVATIWSAVLLKVRDARRSAFNLSLQQHK